jgi:hypothetical protein
VACEIAAFDKFIEVTSDGNEASGGVLMKRYKGIVKVYKKLRFVGT